MCPWGKTAHKDSFHDDDKKSSERSRPEGKVPLTQMRFIDQTSGFRTDSHLSCRLYVDATNASKVTTDGWKISSFPKRKKWKPYSNFAECNKCLDREVQFGFSEEKSRVLMENRWPENVAAEAVHTGSNFVSVGSRSQKH